MKLDRLLDYIVLCDPGPSLNTMDLLYGMYCMFQHNRWSVIKENPMKLDRMLDRSWSKSLQDLRIEWARWTRTHLVHELDDRVEILKLDELKVNFYGE